jgi:SWI/SNF-related matrix-associated actin-dependent regulator 1 of chromatin subfamily A
LKLDFVPQTGAYTLRVKRADYEKPGLIIKDLIADHGLNFSSTASTAAEAVLFTREPYAAAAFAKYASPLATQNMGRILKEIETSEALNSGAHISVPADQELWDFQKASVAYALNRNYTLVADQPGLGKTPIAIAYANEIGAKRVLCIVPANIRGQWEKRIRQWSTMRWPYSIYPIYHGRHGVHPTANWTIVSYDLARSPALGAALAKGTYDLLIVDEGHMLKTADSKRTQAVFGGGLHPAFAPLASRCGAVMVLTGTPLPNRPREAYTLARNLCWDAIDFASEDDFRERFNPSIRMEGERYNPDLKKMETYYYIDERTGRHAELQSRMRANFMTRHLKRDVMTQLQMPVFDIIHLTENAAIKQALNAEKLLDINPENFAGVDIATMGSWAIVRQQLGLAAAPQIAEYVEMLIDGGEEKIVLAGWHIAVLDIWCKLLAKYGTVRIDGSVGPKVKERLVAEFVGNPKIRICIGNMQSMGTGTDGLQAVCNHVLIGEPSPVPGENEQMVDRLDRGGQDKTVQADFFVIPGSLMEKALGSSLRKLTATHAALDKKVA